jgi:hypothetical protein
MTGDVKEIKGTNGYYNPDEAIAKLKKRCHLPRKRGPEDLEKTGLEASAGNKCQPAHPKGSTGAVIQTKTHHVIS